MHAIGRVEPQRQFQEGGVGDRWEVRGDDGYWIRGHRTPTTAIFAPHKVPHGPGRKSRLSAVRETIGVDENGKKQEPFELATMDFPDEFMGVVSEKMNLRKGRMTEMKVMGSGRTRVIFRVPSRGLIGFRSEFLNDSRGQGIMNTLFDGWDDYTGHITFRANGSLIADRKGQTTAYALYHLQPRGKLFLGPGEEIYEGMIVGENSRNNDMNVNACRSKQLTNFRSSGADEKLILAPPVQITLERAMEFIADDELIEVTPNHIRLRKRALAANQRSVVRGPKKEKKKK